MSDARQSIADEQAAFDKPGIVCPHQRALAQPGAANRFRIERVFQIENIQENLAFLLVGGVETAFRDKDADRLALQLQGLDQPMLWTGSSPRAMPAHQKG